MAWNHHPTTIMHLGFGLLQSHTPTAHTTITLFSAIHSCKITPPHVAHSPSTSASSISLGHTLQLQLNLTNSELILQTFSGGST